MLERLTGQSFARFDPVKPFLSARALAEIAAEPDARERQNREHHLLRFDSRHDDDIAICETEDALFVCNWDLCYRVLTEAPSLANEGTDSNIGTLCRQRHGNLQALASEATGDQG